MMKYREGITILIFAFSFNVVCGQGTITGTVSDETTHEPLQGVYVVFGKGQGVVTGEDGTYIIRTSEPQLTLTFNFVGYKDLTRSVNATQGETTILDVSLQTDIMQIGQIVVSANRSGQKISSITVSMDLIQSADLTRNHITDTEELISKTPGIEVMDGQASIRGGTGFSYGAGSRVLALIDGLPVLSPDAGNIKWQFLPLENISQVEIIKGASSVLYGSSALNGIINFRTAEATKDPDTRFFAEAGIFGKPENRNWIWWNTPRVFSSVSFSHLQKAGNNDIGVGLNYTGGNGYRKYNDEALGRMSLRLKHYNQKLPGLSYGINLNSGYTDKADFVLWENAVTGALKQDTSTVSYLHGSLIAIDPYISFDNKGKFKHDVRFRLQSAANRFPVRSANNSDAISVYGEYQAGYAFSERWNFIGGFAGNINKVISNFYGDHKGFNLAAFAQGEGEILTRLRLIGGVRLEYNSLDGINDKLIPVFRSGLNWQAGKYTFIRGSFGQGYRYPSIAEKFASTTLGSIRIIPNPAILSESGWSSEIGIKQGIKAGKMQGQADLSLFLSRNKDLIEFQLTNYPYFGFMARNVEQSRIYGYEAEFSLEKTEGPFPVKIGGGYTFIHPVEVNPVTGKSAGDYLKYRRKHSLKLSAGAGYRKFEAGIDIYVKSKILRIDNVFLLEATRETILPGFYDYWLSDNKGYLLADGNLGYKISDHLTLSVAVKNLTNTEYMGRPGDIQPQRNYSLRFAGNF